MNMVTFLRAMNCSLLRLGLVLASVAIFTFQSTSLANHAASHAIQTVTQNFTQTAEDSPTDFPNRNDEQEGQCTFCAAFHSHVLTIVPEIVGSQALLLIDRLDKPVCLQAAAISFLIPAARAPPALLKT